MLLVGGQDGEHRFADVTQFNLGGFLMQFDGIDDEIMVPHLTHMYLPVHTDHGAHPTHPPHPPSPPPPSPSP